MIKSRAMAPHHCKKREKMGNPDFSWALQKLKQGFKLTRKGWNGKGMWCALQVHDPHSKMKRPYLYLKDVNDLLGPWTPSATDLLADDWQLFES